MLVLRAPGGRVLTNSSYFSVWWSDSDFSDFGTVKYRNQNNETVQMPKRTNPLSPVSKLANQPEIINLAWPALCCIDKLHTNKACLLAQETQFPLEMGMNPQLRSQMPNRRVFQNFEFGSWSIRSGEVHRHHQIQ